jgi:UDP-N-acetylglucosamine diphosphorylase / glucose-1-phosphate thymidylyltransferase / UDP-N-acetylgalactosamine diphosphorylase / glucosamine-1-phosphate N-acetyltransferase / galactosamine-1-phosphate N-acetyltransferase
MQAVILAAGRGTRLGRLTAHRSKAMLPVLGLPLVGRVLEGLWAAGLRHFVVVGGPEDRALADYLHSGVVAPGAVSYVVQPERWGMAHALSCAAPLIEGAFMLVACDNLVSNDFVAALVSHLSETGADGVLALLHMSPEKLQHSAAVELTAAGQVRRIVEKPPPGSVQSDAGSIALYAFGPALMNYLDVRVSSRGEQELQDAIQALIEAGGEVRGLFTTGRRTVTRPADLLALNLYYLDQSVNVEVQAALPSDVELIPPVRIEAGVRVAGGASSILGPRVYLESGCRIGTGVVLRDAVVLRGSVVPDGSRVIHGIWSGNQTC